mmetsp:Transcript_12114/g.48750  ORF Transcript_12114/g.48750 Transcript_12114/m.48750 type:complete len:602 (+) Transcript_12114:67-1872(+)
MSVAEQQEAEAAVLEMIAGGTLLKCGRSGSPHFRVFTISKDLTTLTWTSPKKNSNETSIPMRDVKELKIGQTTAVFAKNPLPEYAQFSFSLIYTAAGQVRTLDVVCKDKAEFDVWAIGLRHLITGNANLDAAKLERKLSKMDSLDRERLSITFRGTQTIVNKREDSSDVYSWGQGVNGRLGHGDENDQLQPKVIEVLLGKDVRAIACGPSHTAALNAVGDLYTWGAGSQGRLGHGHERDRFTPLLVSGLIGKKVFQVACGDFHTAALVDGGQMYTWGKGAEGRLGMGDEESRSSPTLVEALQKVTFIACGYVSTAAVTEDGVVYTWGGNDKGQLGHGCKEPRLLPTAVDELAGAAVQQIACATWHTVAITAEGALYTWGHGANGKLGHGDEANQLKPKKVEGIDVVAMQVCCGDFHSALLTDTGEVYTWGEGNYGQLGHGKAISQFNKPLKIAGPLSGRVIVQIACGANHTAALTNMGHLFTWGYAVNGRLGHGEEGEDQRAPKAVAAMAGKHVRQVACGGSHSACTITHGWVPDEESDQCMYCKKAFTFVNRRHHCRNCGGIFCGNCSNKRFPLLKDGFNKPVRVCDRCHGLLSESIASP